MATNPDILAAKALDPQSREPRMDDHPAWPMISRLPVVLAVSIPLSSFKVRDLLGLRPGETVETVWAAIREVPLKVGEVQVAWGEFEVVEQRMALRLTRLA
jgi:flagellar motor switch protein FliN/FliY